MQTASRLRQLLFIAAVLFVSAALPALAQKPAYKLADQGDGTYKNPVLFADYSDPDVIRVGDDYYMVSSSFSGAPGLPVLHSTDLVNWTLISWALPKLPDARYDLPRHGEGVWAPSIRHHAGYYWIYYGDPDLGVFMVRAREARGPWEKPVLVHAAKGWEDTCPLWDDDGQAYLVHGWVKSRAGFNGRLDMARMSPDGAHLLDEGRTVFDGDANENPTIEGPKFYKKDGWYYIFAPAGGVGPGWQTALRSRNVMGPYEHRNVLDSGATSINGPHQGGWVTDVDGGEWFMHFQDRGAYGRITWLEPMTWREGWPIIGREQAKLPGRGEPVMQWKKPAARKPAPLAAPEVGDEFDAATLALHWQWQANPQTGWYSLNARKGWLTLAAEPLPSGGKSLWAAPNVLTQRFPAESFTATTKIDVAQLTQNGRAGLVIMGMDYAALALSKATEGWRLSLSLCHDAHKGGVESEQAQVALKSPTILLRAHVDSGAVVTFSYSVDGDAYTKIGEPFQARKGMWVGAQTALFAIASDDKQAGAAAFDWFRIE